MFKNREEKKKKEEEEERRKEKPQKNILFETVTRLIDSVPVHVSDNTCLTRTVCVIGRELGSTRSMQSIARAALARVVSTTWEYSVLTRGKDLADCWASSVL